MVIDVFSQINLPLSGFRLLYCQTLVVSDIYRISRGRESVNQHDAQRREDFMRSINILPCPCLCEYNWDGFELGAASRIHRDAIHDNRYVDF